MHVDRVGGVRPIGVEVKRDGCGRLLGYSRVGE
jgi:hypothetical protein